MEGISGINDGFMLILEILTITGLSIGYGFGVKARLIPFSEELGFSDRQWSFLKGWVKLALIFGVLLPIALCVQA